MPAYTSVDQAISKIDQVLGELEEKRRKFNSLPWQLQEPFNIDRNKQIAFAHALSYLVQSEEGYAALASKNVETRIKDLCDGVFDNCKETFSQMLSANDDSSLNGKYDYLVFVARYLLRIPALVDDEVKKLKATTKHGKSFSSGPSESAVWKNMAKFPIGTPARAEIFMVMLSNPTIFDYFSKHFAEKMKDEMPHMKRDVERILGKYKDIFNKPNKAIVQTSDLESLADLLNFLTPEVQLQKYYKPAYMFDNKYIFQILNSELSDKQRDIFFAAIVRLPVNKVECVLKELMGSFYYDKNKPAAFNIILELSLHLSGMNTSYSEKADEREKKLAANYQWIIAQVDKDPTLQGVLTAFEKKHDVSIKEELDELNVSINHKTKPRMS